MHALFRDHGEEEGQTEGAEADVVSTGRDEDDVDAAGREGDAAAAGREGDDATGAGEGGVRPESVQRDGGILGVQQVQEAALHGPDLPVHRQAGLVPEERQAGQ